jgi:hypothetical protein
MIETRTAVIHLAPYGIVLVRIKRDATQSLDDAVQNLAAAVEATAQQRRPLLIDIRTAVPLEDEVRRYYSGQMVVEHFTALGLLVDGGPFGRMMANVYFRVAQLGIATQIFATEGDAVAWLLEYRLPSRN